jgi:hypothetical protein
MAIYVITGKNGHGKTAYMVSIIRQALKADQKVFLNFKIYPEKMFKRNVPQEGDIVNEEDRNDPNKRILYWANFSDWKYFNNGVVFVDEGLIYFNARNWESLPAEMQRRLVQHRKDSIDVWLNIAHYSFMEKTIRILCERFINIRLFLGSPKFKKSWIPRISRIYEYELPTLIRCENLGIDPYAMTAEEKKKLNVSPIWQQWYWIKSKMFPWYDTTLKVSESTGLEMEHRERTCLTCGKVAISHA